jgi:hypothetical protein
MMDASLGGGADSLTRTTLQIEGDASASAIAAAIRGLQRVPGVLLAEIYPATTRAVVAHDSAVNTASLVNAVAAAGIRAAIVTAPRAVAPSAPPAFSNAALVRVVVSATIVFAILTLIDLTMPDGADRRWLLPAVSTSLFVFLFARAIGTRRP